MLNLQSDKYRRIVNCGLGLAPLALCFGLARPAAAAEQIAQAIPSVPPMSGIYARPATGSLGQAIDQASSSSADDSSSTIAATPGSVSLPRIDAASHQDAESKFIAQAAAENNSDSPVDLAPVKLPERTSAIFQTDQFKTGLLYKLPARMFIFSTTENSLREETNVFQTLHHNKSDMVYRVLPNLTVGYALTKTTRVAANYFYLRDQYTHDAHTLSRNIHSIGAQINQDIPINDKTTITTGFMGRQLLLSRAQPLTDLLPSVQLTRRFGSNTVLYGGV